MSANTKIEWCDSSWNPVTGCLNGCEYCYARRIANRFKGFECRCGGEFIPDRKTNSIWETTHGKALHIFDTQPLKRIDFRKFQQASYPYGFEPTFHKYRLNVPQKWKKSHTIFVCSMADLFGDWVPDEWISEVFNACEKAPQHRYLFLTKNPKRYTQYGVTIPENNWYGVSITRETEMSLFNSLPARCNTFVSMEPVREDLCPEKHNILFQQVDWIIIGAETGNQKGKIIPEKSWIDHICEAAGNTPVFMKDSLLPIVGEENMRREFPWEVWKNG